MNNIRTLTIVIDTPGAITPYTLINKKLLSVGVDATFYTTINTKPDDYPRLIIDAFDSARASEKTNVFSVEDNKLRLLLESRKVIGDWIPSIISNVLDAIKSKQLFPEETVVIGNSPTFLYLGHFLLALGFKGFIVLEPYRMVDWQQRWQQDTSQMLPQNIPWIDRLLFASHGYSLAKRHYGDIEYNFKDITNAVIAQGYMYSPLLCEDKDTALGYPYPNQMDRELDSEVLAFVDTMSTSRKPIFLLTTGSVTMTEARERAILRAFQASAKAYDAASIIIGMSKYAEDFADETSLFVDYFVPYQKLFPLLDMIFHHHGAGTTHQALLSGTPSYGIVFLPDQIDWAQRLLDIGVSAGFTLAKDFNAERTIQDLANNYNEHLIQQALQMSYKVEQDGLEKITEFIMKAVNNL